MPHGQGEVRKRGPIPVDGDHLPSRAQDIGKSQREGTASGSEVEPAVACPGNPVADQPDVIGVVHDSGAAGDRCRPRNDQALSPRSASHSS
jgi:hypothetical protein